MADVCEGGEVEDVRQRRYPGAVLKVLTTGSGVYVYLVGRRVSTDEPLQEMFEKLHAGAWSEV